jgi:hypothetical protein
LLKLDPIGWRNSEGNAEGYLRWLALMTACKAAGISADDFVAWCVQDPMYAADADEIRRKWDFVVPKHSGALWAELSKAGIKLGREKKERVEVPSRHPSQLDWRIRFTGIIDWLRHNKTERDLFSASCLVAEIIAQHHKPKPSVAVDFLVKAAKGNGLLKSLGEDEVRRTIVNGLHHIEQKILAREEPQ